MAGSCATRRWCNAGAILLVAAIAACSGGRKAAGARDAGGRAAAAVSDAAPPAPAVLPRLAFGEVRVLDLGWDERVPALDEATVRALVDAQVKQEGTFAGAEGAVRAKLEIALGAELDKGTLRVLVALRVRFTDGDVQRTMEARVAGERPLAKADVPAQVKATLERAVADALGELAARDKIRRGDDDALIAALGSEDADVRGEALRAVAVRKVRKAVPRLIELLSSSDAEVRDGALGALVALRAEEAVKPLIEMVELGDVDTLRRIIDAVGAIGGEEAHAYLEMVATGHDVPGVRELAKEALERMERRGDAGVGDR